MKKNTTSKCLLLFILLAIYMIPISSLPILQLGTSERTQLSERISTLADDSTASLTWSSRDQPFGQAIENGSIISGDHITLNGSILAPNIVETKLHIWNGFFYTATNELANYTIGGQFSDMINPDDWSWTSIEGVRNGDNINVTCEFTNSGCDIFFWGETEFKFPYSASSAVFYFGSNSSPLVGSFTWTSDYDRIIVGCMSYESDPIGNWTIEALVGNHKIFTDLGSSVHEDTYFLDSDNQNYSIRVTGRTDTNETITKLWKDVTICNFYTPVFSFVYVYPLLEDAKSFNISWSCYDNNSDDVNYFQIWLSNNDGVSYMLLTTNMTQTWYVWNSSGWLEDSYTVRVRAFSVDLTSPECSLENPPSSYWPHDYSDTFATVNAGDVPTPGPGFFTLDIAITSNPSYYFGATGNILSVSLIFHGDLPYGNTQYSVTDNGTTWLQGEYFISSYENILPITVDGLSIGHHVLEFTILNSQSKTYTIDVIAPTSISTTLVDTSSGEQLFRAFAIGISIGSASIIVAVVALSIRLKRNRVIEILES